MIKVVLSFFFGRSSERDMCGGKTMYIYVGT